jgi:hypothetical protein
MSLIIRLNILLPAVCVNTFPVDVPLQLWSMAFPSYQLSDIYTLTSSFQSSPTHHPSIYLSTHLNTLTFFVRLVLTVW